MVEIMLALVGCAALLALIALYYRLVDSEVIDEEEEAAVEAETPEEHARARLREEETPAPPETGPYDGFI